MNPRQLQSFCRIVQGGRLGLSGNDFVEKGYPSYGAGGLNGYLTKAEFSEPAVVLSSIGARCGKCFYAAGEWTSLANTQLIFPDPSQADVRFLWHQLNDEGRWHRSGTGQPFIKPSDVKAHHVFLPSLDEQRRIARILDQAETLRAKRRQALAKLDSLTQSLFLEMFGDPLSNSPRWPVQLKENQRSISPGALPRDNRLIKQHLLTRDGLNEFSSTVVFRSHSRTDLIRWLDRQAGSFVCPDERDRQRPLASGSQRTVRLCSAAPLRTLQEDCPELIEG